MLARIDLLYSMSGQPVGMGLGATGSVRLIVRSFAMTNLASSPVRKFPNALPVEVMPCTITTGEDTSYLTPIQSIVTAQRSQPTAPLDKTAFRLPTSISRRN